MFREFHVEDIHIEKASIDYFSRTHNSPHCYSTVMLFCSVFGIYIIVCITYKSIKWSILQYEYISTTFCPFIDRVGVADGGGDGDNGDNDEDASTA